MGVRSRCWQISQFPSAVISIVSYGSSGSRAAKQVFESLSISKRIHFDCVPRQFRLSNLGMGAGSVTGVVVFNLAGGVTECKRGGCAEPAPPGATGDLGDFVSSVVGGVAGSAKVILGLWCGTLLCALL